MTAQKILLHTSNVFRSNSRTGHAKPARLILLGLACVALLAGCATQRELIEKRISQKSAYFSTLPADDQQRIREGKLVSGDTRDAVWIAYGRPDRVFQKVTGTTTNEVWSYVDQDVTYTDELRPVYFPVHSIRGRTVWHTDFVWTTDRYYTPYDYLRIEFQNDRVLTIETEKR
jgi:hypothetical protein